MWPFLLQYGNKDEVELVEESLLSLERLFGRGALDDEVDDEVADSLALLSWEDLPSCLNNVVEHL